MTMLWENKKNGQPPPQPPEPLLLREMPLLATLKWSQKQLKNQSNVPLHQEVVDRVSAAMKGPVKQRRELGRRLLRGMPSYLVDKIDEQNKAE